MYEKIKYITYQTFVIYSIYVRDRKYEFCKKAKIVIENIQNNKFMIPIFFKKNVNILLNSTIFNVRKLIFKSFILNVIKYFPNII